MPVATALAPGVTMCWSAAPAIRDDSPAGQFWKSATSQTRDDGQGLGHVPSHASPDTYQTDKGQPVCWSGAVSPNCVASGEVQPGRRSVRTSRHEREVEGRAYLIGRSRNQTRDYSRWSRSARSWCRRSSKTLSLWTSMARRRSSAERANQYARSCPDSDPAAG